MGPYFLKRLAGVPVILFVLVTLTFVMVRLAPGGPFDTEKKIPEETLKKIEAFYGMHLPIHVQYWNYLKGLVRLDFGPSFSSPDRTVNEIIEAKYGPSLWIGLSAMLIALIAGVATGTISALKQNTVFDYASMSWAMIGLSLPTFVVAPILMAVFALWLGWVRVTYENFWASQFVIPLLNVPFGLPKLQALALPALSLSLPYTARIARLTRTGMLDVIHQDYIRTARSKGLKERTVILRHAFRGGIMPVISYLGPAIAFILTGSLVIEKIFQIPGLGSEFVDAAVKRDYFMTLALVVISGGLLVFANLFVDILYGFLDPRIRYE